jgi:hypothetical protein
MPTRPDLDGLFIQLPGGSTVYLIDQGQARPLPNDHSFTNALFNPRGKVWTVSLQIDIGPSVDPQQAGLAMGPGQTAIYWYDEGERIRHIADPETFERYNFNSNSIQTAALEPVATEELSWVPKYSGNRIKALSAPEVYLVDQGMKRHITDGLTSHLLFGDTLPARIDSVDGIPSGPDIGSDTRLIKGDQSPEIYLYDQGTKRHILDPNTMSYYRFAMGTLEGRPQAVVDAMPSGDDIAWPGTGT